MQKNVASQKWTVFAFDRTDNTPKTGDSANITANLRIDGGAANAVDDTNPTELEDGFYVFDLTQAETNGDMILISPASVTADIQVIGVPGVVYTTAPNFNALGIESDGDVTKTNLCANTTLVDTVTDVTNEVSADMVKINSVSASAVNLEQGAFALQRGSAVAGTLSTTQMSTNLTEATDDHFNGRIITWTSGVLNKQSTDITDYVGATKVLTFTATTEAPSDTDTFVIS